LVVVLLALNGQGPPSPLLPEEAASEAEPKPTGQPDPGPETGAAQGPAETAAEDSAASSSPRQNPPDDVMSMPLVFQDVDRAALNLDPGQRQAIADLRQRFIEALGGPNQDPAEPAYRERWQQSQPENDDLLRGLIGVRAWQDYQLAARRHE